MLQRRHRERKGRGEEVGRREETSLLLLLLLLALQVPEM